MRRALSVSELSPSEFISRLDQTVAVYAAAMQQPPGVLPGRRSTMLGHSVNPGFRALLATEDGSDTVVAFTYGFHGAPGQWWHDTVARALVTTHGAAAAAWLDNSFEVAELHVAPEHQGHGVGAACCNGLPRADWNGPRCCPPGTPTRRPGGCTAGWASPIC